LQQNWTSVLKQRFWRFATACRPRCASFLPTSNPGGASFSYDPHPTSHNPSC
jgi:hypothetical protein